MGKPGNSELLRHIPQVDRLLSLDEFRPLIDQHSRPLVLRQVRGELDDLRQRATAGKLDRADLEAESICARVARDLDENAVPYYRRVINGTGVILHTGLGRSPLSKAAVDALTELAGHPVRVEIDLESGDRGGRDAGCGALLRELTGAEAATVVNNNAGATLLILAALARGREVILSRGEMVEIGGSFRVPEIMEEGGAILKGVGTTNRTHPHDYQRAVNDQTGMILKVHTSNYRVEGFTREVEIEELTAIGREHQIPVVHDMGSGCFVDLRQRGLDEPLVQRSIAAGADLVCFSGDKLLGGPQSGIIVGTQQAVERCRRHPLYRALRPGRLTYIALESTLRIYQQGDEAVLEQIPAMARLTATPEELEPRAQRLARKLVELGLPAEVTRETSQAGSGTLPALDFPTWVVRIPACLGADAAQLARYLRSGNPPILARVRDGAVLLDVRTLEDSEFALIEKDLQQLTASKEPNWIR